MRTKMNAYEKARDLIQRIESHRVEINTHQKMIAELQVGLRSALREADLKTSNGPEAPPAKAKTDVSNTLTAVKRSQKKKVVIPQAVIAPPRRAIAPSKTGPVKPARKQVQKPGSSSYGQKNHVPDDRPTLGDLVRTVIIKAGHPLKRLEIQAGLQELNYSNSTRDPYKTLGVRLHRLESRGVVSIGNSQFDVTPQWKRKHARLILAAEKRAAKQVAVTPAALVTTPEPATTAAR
jgi:hypothetical protein